VKLVVDDLCRVQRVEEATCEGCNRQETPCLLWGGHEMVPAEGRCSWSLRDIYNTLLFPVANFLLHFQSTLNACKHMVCSCCL